MFLKAYLNVSDRHLIERFNTDYSLQMFCGKLLAEDRQIRDTTIMAKPYVRPIVRGKENKPVEFGIACPDSSAFFMGRFILVI